MRAKITAAVVSSITVKQTLITKKIEAWFSFRFLYMVANKSILCESFVEFEQYLWLLQTF